MNLAAAYLNLYSAIEQDLLSVMQSDPIFGCLPGIVIEPGSIESAIDAKVTAALGAGPDGKVGTGYLILPIEDLIDADVEVEFGPMQIPIGVQIVQNVILDNGPRGRKLHLRELGAYGLKMLKSYSGQNLTSALIPANPAVSLFTPDRDQNLRLCQINLKTYEQDPTPFQQVSSPFLTPSIPVSPTAGQNVYPMNLTIGSNDSESVYYTLDGTNPWPGLLANPATNFKGIQTSATKWNGHNPVAVNGPCLFRARAFAPIAGKLGSKTASIFFA